MAGSSMDGLDIVTVDFDLDGEWNFSIVKSETIPYDDLMLKLLKESSSQVLKDQQIIDWVFGEWIGEKLLKFGVEGIDLIGVHGHTVTHDPKNGVSWQLGRGDVIAETTNIRTVSNFRSKDVSLGGEGAPLVPIGDFNLFSAYDACLNLGGIANVSVKEELLAWDICPCNQVLNFYANSLGKEYDESGTLARKGKLNQDWISKLRIMNYFDREPPKSLPNQFIKKEMLESIKPLDGLKSYNIFQAEQIQKDLSSFLPEGSRVLVTGGGGYNDFLMELLNKNPKNWQFILPSDQIISFKEALIFAFLAVKKMREETNVLASVTGATSDSSSGVIHDP